MNDWKFVGSNDVHEARYNSCNIGVVRRYLSNIENDHCKATRWISRYLKGTSKTCSCYGELIHS